MIRAAAGNAALDRGDAVAALAEFDAAVAFHDLPVYRVGQAIARGRIGDDAGAADALAAAGRAEPFTFVLAAEASLRDVQRRCGDAAVAAGPYDPTASSTLPRTDTRSTRRRRHITWRPSWSRSRPPRLLPPPEGLFDAETWTAAQPKPSEPWARWNRSRRQRWPRSPDGPTTPRRTDRPCPPVLRATPSTSCRRPWPAVPTSMTLMSCCAEHRARSTSIRPVASGLRGRVPDAHRRRPALAVRCISPSRCPDGDRPRRPLRRGLVAPAPALSERGGVTARTEPAVPSGLATIEPVFRPK